MSRGSLHFVPVKLTPCGAGLASKPAGNGTPWGVRMVANGTMTVG